MIYRYVVDEAKEILKTWFQKGLEAEEHKIPSHKTKRILKKSLIGEKEIKFDKNFTQKIKSIRKKIRYHDNSSRTFLSQIPDVTGKLCIEYRG